MIYEKEPLKLYLNDNFLKKSNDKFDLDIGQIQTLIKHRDRMDELMIETPPDKQLLRSLYLRESQLVTKKINNFLNN